MIGTWTAKLLRALRGGGRLATVSFDVRDGPRNGFAVLGARRGHTVVSSTRRVGRAVNGMRDPSKPADYSREASLRLDISDIIY